MRVLGIFIFCGLMVGAGSAWAQGTETSTGAAQNKAQDAQDELDSWEEDSGDIFDAPFEEEGEPAPAGPRIQAPPPAAPPPPDPPPPPPKAAPPPPPPAPPPDLGPIQRVPLKEPGAAKTEAQVDIELYRAGERQRATGNTLFISGIVGLVAGAALGTVGYVGLVSNLGAYDENESSTASGAMFLGGGVTLAAGAGLVIAGTVMRSKGDRKMRKAQILNLTSLNPTFIDGQVKGMQAGFQF